MGTTVSTYLRLHVSPEFHRVVEAAAGATIDAVTFVLLATITVGQAAQVGNVLKYCLTWKRAVDAHMTATVLIALLSPV